MDYFSSRELLGGDAIIGVTCHNSRELAFKAAQAGADYVAFGAFFETPTKTPKFRAELEILEWWHQAVEVGVWNHPKGAAEAVKQFSKLCLAYA